MLRTPVFKFLQIGAVVLLVLALTLSSTGAQTAQAATSTQISDGWMPFTGSLYDSQTNSTISGNSASNGGGINNYSGNLSITNSTFSGNHAANTGGGIYSSAGTEEVVWQTW